jgi:diguanylate cyclase (GGDEF)-like protein
MGGEEFLLLMPGMPREAAAARLDRLRQRITEACQALQVPGLEVTASIGLAQWRPGEDDLAALLRRADHAMYVAKRAGRNRVFDGEELDPPAPA